MQMANFINNGHGEFQVIPYRDCTFKLAVFKLLPFI